MRKAGSWVLVASLFVAVTIPRAFASFGSSPAWDALLQRLREIRVTSERPGDRKEVLELEDQLLDLAFSEAEQRGSEEGLDETLRWVAHEVSATGIDSSADESLHRIIAKVDGEHWGLVEEHPFSIWMSIFRSQGLTTDREGNYWYSSQQSLLRSDSKWGTEDLLHFFPLPNELNRLGDNHIGDIDYADGKIYAGAEDGATGYQHPFIVVFDAVSLKAENYVALPRGQQIDGVPWVAVDAATKHAFSSQYSNTTRINVYDLSTLAPVTQIPMSRAVDSIQGAKVLNGNLYLSANGDTPGTYSVYKMNLSTGTVMQVGSLPGNLVEVEGLAFSPTSRGHQLDVLSVIPVGGFFGHLLHLKRTELCGFKIDQESRRDRLRRDIGVLP